MNIFRLLGDLSHLIAILILLFKIWRTRSCSGVSGRTIILYTLVFLTRYLDIFDRNALLYNTVFKIFYLASSFLTLYFIYFAFKVTYNRHNDTFSIALLIAPCAVLALLINHSFHVKEILWTFSIYLEAVAVQPQLYMISKTGEAESITTHYLFALGLYRLFYIFNWVYRYYYEDFLDLIVVVAGCIQTILYCDFFYLYVTKVLRGKKLYLPA
ncbi:hypothetical protein GJ496_009940 [Pomphorhynchus laevis]|nr:hypothetical protein GJ496_009940 [Pomphorhynchus laevis]